MAKKKIGIKVAVIISIIVFIAFALSGFKLPLAISGTNTLSLSQASLQSSNSYLNGKVWLLTFAAGGLGQSYYGSFSPNDIQSATTDQSTSTNDFSIKVDYEDTICSYPIQNTGYQTPIYDIKKVVWNWVPFTDPCSTSEAQSRGLSNVIKVMGPTSIYQILPQCIAIGYSTQSAVGYLSSPNKGTEYTINLNVAGKTASKTINTLSGSNQGQIGDYAYAVWQGNLDSGISCQDKDPYTPINVNGVWRITKSTDYNNYLNYWNQRSSITEGNIDTWLSNMQNAILRAKSGQFIGTINSATSLNFAVLNINSQSSLAFPVTTLYIKADTLGIYTPTPEIKLLNASSDCFSTGSSGGIAVKLQNVGSETGTWNLYAKCNSPFTQTQSVQVSLQAGETTTRILPISASASSEQKATCTIYAESSQGIKNLNVNVCVKPQISCQANQQFCDVLGSGYVIKQCSSDGATSSTIKTCQQGESCQIVNNIGTCVLGGGENGNSGLKGVWDSIVNFFKNLFNFTGGILSIARFVVFALVVISTTLFSKDLLVVFKELRKKKLQWLAWTLSIIVGLLVGYFAFKIFYLSLILLAVFLIYKFTPLNKVVKRIFRR